MNSRINVLLTALILFVSCSKDDVSYREEGYAKVFPIFVVNEGKYAENSGIGSVGLYDQSENRYKASFCGGETNVGLGGTPLFATMWVDTVYVVSKDNNLGHVLSAYDSKTGGWIRGYKTDAGVKGSSFIVINNKFGVLSTSGAGAIVLDMATLTPLGTLKGTSTYVGDMAVSGNNLFVIDNQRTLLAYSLENILEEEPKNLGSACGGFVEDRNGFLWAYDNKSTCTDFVWNVVDKTSLLKIDSKSALVVESVDIGVAILPSLLSYRPSLMVSSISENAFFFIKSSEVENNIIYKYRVEDKSLEFHKIDGYSLINIVYNPSNNGISAIVRKLPEYTNYEIINLDAKSGKEREKSYKCVGNDSNKFPTFLMVGK